MDWTFKSLPPAKLNPQPHGLDLSEEPPFFLSAQRKDRGPANASGPLEPHWVEVIEAATD